MHCTYLGVSGYNFSKYLGPDEMQHNMLSSLVCKSTHLAVSRKQRVNHNPQDTYTEVGMSLFNYLIKCLKGSDRMGNSVNQDQTAQGAV